MNNLIKDTKDSVFNKLSQVKCKVEKKGRFNYVSWASSWKEVKRLYPNANFKVYTTEAGFPAFISKAHGGFVKVGVTINNIEHIEYFPITDNYNKAIKHDFIDVFNINTSIKRALVKAISMHGLGLYVYEGEDLPNFDEDKK